MSSFQDRFNELLQRTGIDASTLAANLEVSKQTISAWKTGVRSPKRPVLKIIAKYFDVSLPWLCGLDVPVGSYQDSAVQLPGEADEAVSMWKLTIQEQRLVSAYRDADPRYRDLAMELLEEHPEKSMRSGQMA